ncbi:hypothetical protein AGMMS49982_08060 [Bacteroidia bacterium]|nr:hypothetical protein AGMMS49982_08060 [Bacteroidia bacterium]
MTKFKNVFFMAAMAASVSVFSGCGDDGDPSEEQSSVFDDQGLTSSVFDGKIQATVAGGDSLNSKIDFVKAFGLHSAKYYEDEVASAPYVNGGFTLQLPETMPALDKFQLPESITVSDTTANTVECSIKAYKGATEVGYFYYVSEFVGGAIFIYADKDVSVTGSGLRDNEVVTYRVSLKRGWNKAYVRGKNTTPTTREYTSTEPSGLKWIFWPNSNF